MGDREGDVHVVGHQLRRAFTYVLHLEGGEWKVVQVHWSLARPNVEFLGRALTTSLDELERTLQRERPDLSETLAQDGTVTIVFTDIVDSTVMLRELGDHAWLPRPPTAQRSDRTCDGCPWGHGR